MCGFGTWTALVAIARCLKVDIIVDIIASVSRRTGKATRRRQRVRLREFVGGGADEVFHKKHHSRSNECNYTGDRMAFDMGREMTEAEGIQVGTVIVDDDVSVKDSTFTVGRRGVAGNFFVMKALGAGSARGDSLGELVALGNRVNSVTRQWGWRSPAARRPPRARRSSSSALTRSR